VVEQEFGEVYPGQVEAVHVANDTSALDPLVAEYQRLKRALEDLLDQHIMDRRRLKKNIKRKMVRGAALRCAVPCDPPAGSGQAGSRLADGRGLGFRV
jgi:hypothetical protein